METLKTGRRGAFQKVQRITNANAFFIFAFASQRAFSAGTCLIRVPNAVFVIPRVAYGGGTGAGRTKNTVCGGISDIFTQFIGKRLAYGRFAVAGAGHFHN